MPAFRLAGLLKLRHVQQDAAGARLASANERLRDAADRRVAARRTLADTTTEITDASMLSGLAASRAAGRGMLSELDAVVARRQAERDDAEREYGEARRAVKGLERLESLHVAEAVRAELAAEQTALDEIAIARSAASVPPAGAADLAADRAVAARPAAPAGAVAGPADTRPADTRPVARPVAARPAARPEGSIR